MAFKPRKLPYEEFKAIYSKAPRLCVDLIFKTDEGVLLIERTIEPAKGLWHFPGGTVLMGESIREAIKRVALEEAGLSVEDYDLSGYMEFNTPDNPVFHTVSMVFLIRKFYGELSGGKQGGNIRYHRILPERIIPEQRKFLLERRILNTGNEI